MSDEMPVPESDEPGRDEHVRELLAVPPLDDVTRRRLVRRAVDAADEAAAPRSRNRSRLALAVPVAAAIAVGLVVGAVVVTRPEDPAPTAARAPSSTPAPQGDGERAASSDAPALVPADAAITDLGDLGTVANADDLRTTALVAQAEASAGESADDSTGGRILPCTERTPDAFGLATLASAGTATYEGAPVTILLGRDADGRVVAVAVTVDTCAPVLRTALTA